MNIELARSNMLTQQLHTWDVLDKDILKLIAHTPREKFVPAAYQDLAFADMNIPLGHDQVMWTPKEEGRVLQALNIKPTDQVLEIGTGSGYFTALLAKLARQVDSIDIFADFTEQARQKLAMFGLSHVTLITADAAQGWQGNYDVIVITGSLPYLPESFRQNLKPGGRLFAILGQVPAMEATLMTRDECQDWQEERVFETVVPPLLNALELPKFTF